MSIGVGLSSAAAAQAQENARPRSSSIAAKPLGEPIFWVVETAQQALLAKLDLDGDSGLDATELEALGGLGAGKNGSAGFAAADRDGDGRLSLRELRASGVFSPETLNGLLDQQAGLAGFVVSEGDADGDGGLSLEEFRKVGPEGVLADRAFEAADADGDGVVSARELPTVMQSYVRVLPSSSFNAKAVARDLMRHDLDDDGALSGQELAPPAATGAVDLNALFDAADGDGDGLLTLAEIEAQIAQEPDYYDMGARKLPDALRPLDPSAPDYLERVRDRLTAAANLDPISPGQDALRRLLRENFARLTEQMVAQITPSRSALT